ncbi:hypothetical protein M427DRAFT_57151 [Gonapodya prolifera JEL478]|uniref:Uncharacterized protein n=1 Tax=Gonapodya prolifera (strain JEL478) TaxID=1344416 RepID=A0A139AF15_GONPJ|nr:hypothetical protein M427DRAFT_57151 [Gonapodya prolifera JEL478]|eukprot:KXS15013.1 hypothetical protein M427DRAFT_57151 [Gonapodya prolifera JEL478]
MSNAEGVSDRGFQLAIRSWRNTRSRHLFGGDADRQNPRVGDGLFQRRIRTFLSSLARVGSRYLVKALLDSAIPVMIVAFAIPIIRTALFLYGALLPVEGISPPTCKREIMCTFIGSRLAIFIPVYVAMMLFSWRENRVAPALRFSRGGWGWALQATSEWNDLLSTLLSS